MIFTVTRYTTNMAPMYRPLRHDVFKHWSPRMAYVLGFFAADGTMIANNRGAHFIEFHNTDRILIVKVKEFLGSGHKISGTRRSPRHKICYRLQIGSKEIFNDLSNLGFVPNKSNVLQLPSIPERYLSHYVRGYFDGDGNVYFKKHWVKGRKKKKWIFTSRFTSGSKQYLIDLHCVLKQHGVERGFIIAKSQHKGHDLVFSHRDSLALYRLMYNTAADTGFFLPRKYKIFQKAIRTLYPALDRKSVV